ncbi:MAG: hypothetical protein ACLPY5_05315 [Candidatus Bathyarchaeia archaeon]
MRKLLEDASQRAIRYLEHLDERNVAPTLEGVSSSAGISAGIDLALEILRKNFGEGL